MSYDITYFKGSHRNTKGGDCWSFDVFKELADEFKVCAKGAKHSAYVVRGELKNGERKDANMSVSNLLVIDGDEGLRGKELCSPKSVHEALLELNINHFIYTTHSHSASVNKFRVFIAATTYNKQSLKANNKSILKLLAGKDCKIKNVKEMGAWSQPWFVPTRDNPEDGLFEHYSFTDGNDWESIHVEENKTEAETQTSESRAEGGESLDELYENIRSGKEYHESLRTISYQYIKDGMSAANCKAILRTMLDGSSDAGSERWKTRYNDIDRLVDGAVSRKDDETKFGEAPKEYVPSNVPSFPRGVLRTLPEPWPQIYDMYESVAREPIEALLVPTVLSSMAHFLCNKYQTFEEKNLNLMFLNLAPSSSGKDANSTSVLNGLSKKFRVGAVSDPFVRFSQYYTTVTSDTSFMEAFKDNDFFWVDTEVTNFFKMMSNSGGNASVSGVSTKIIEVGNGVGLSAKKKAGKDGNSEGIPNPNCQILFYAQPDTISEYLNMDMIDSGLFGRPIMSISDVERKGRPRMFNNSKSRRMTDVKLDEEIMKFCIHLGEISKVTNIFIPHTIIPTDSEIDTLEEWYGREMWPLMEADEVMNIILRRIGIPFEQTWSVIIAVIREWELFKYGKVETKSIGCEKLLPLFEFWKDCKIYAVKELVNDNVDPLVEAIIGVCRDIMNKKCQPSKVGHRNAIKESKIPISYLYEVLKNRSKLLKSIELGHMGLNAKLNITIDGMVKTGTLSKVKIKSMECVAFPLL